MKKSSRGQSMLEALFVVVFTTIIMFAFLQVCIMVVDDMTANEAAFVAMRSAAVTEKDKREQEAKERLVSYLLLFYPFSSAKYEHNSSNLVFSDAKKVSPYYGNRHDSTNSLDSITLTEASRERYDDDNSTEEDRRKYTDFSGSTITALTVKFYYFTRVMFGSLVAKNTSEETTFIERKLLGLSGSRRYQASRSRMVPSPDDDFYYRAYPNARKFNEK